MEVYTCQVIYTLTGYYLLVYTLKHGEDKNQSFRLSL
ncbi:MAG: hypothetical protein QOH70_3408 [Blastocatellia bacterium]|jgi:hypothetical protein|nr:hypothetical protein [Blastocatellia bacterium]